MNHLNKNFKTTEKRINELKGKKIIQSDAGRRIGQTTLEEIMAKSFSKLVKDTEQ